jgi:hypothetical protein
MRGVFREIYLFLLQNPEFGFCEVLILGIAAGKRI